MCAPPHHHHHQRHHHHHHHHHQADNEWRASALGSYRFWRDLGFAIGGIIAAGIADAYGISVAFGVLIGICCLSAAQFAWYYENPNDKYITLPQAEEGGGVKLAEVAVAAAAAAPSSSAA